MIEGSLEYIDYQRESMQPDEWLVYLYALHEAIAKRIDEAESREGG